MKFATRYVPLPSPEITFTQPSQTDQSQAKDCDINFIIDRCRKTGYLVDPMHPGTRQPIYGDFTSIPDYQGCLDVVVRAQDAFGSLPAKLRDRFGNDPAQLIAFLNDPGNRDEAISLGLVAKSADVKDEGKSSDLPANSDPQPHDAES